MKRILHLATWMLCALLTVPAFAITPASDPPDGYLRANEAPTAPDGYLPASSQNKASDRALDPARPEGFVPADKASPESVDGGKLMLLAYAGFWLIALLYIATLAQRARRTRNEVLELHRQLQEIDDRLEDLETRRQA